MHIDISSVKFGHAKCICMCVCKHSMCVHETLAKPHTNEFVMHIFHRSVTSTLAHPCTPSAYMKHLPNHIQMNLACTYSTDPSVTSTHAQPYRLYQGRVLRPQGVKTTHDQLRRAQGLRPGKAHMVAACGKNQTLPSLAHTFPSYVPTHL
jgi:hypothetical protein